jgi:trimethylamine-N-oxide reductase (cytochrome c)
MKSSKIETIIVQHPWMENDTLYSDIILPINTFLEENDIGMTSLVAHYGVIFPSGQTCDSIGESMSDYEAVGEVAKKMGIYDEYTGGMTVDEWIKYGFDTSGATSYITWEELQRRGTGLYL